MENVATNSEQSNAVRIVSKDGCKYCVKAKEFLTAQNIPFQVEKLDPEAEGYKARRDELVEATGQKTFPWVYIGPEFVGGFSELEHSFNTFKLHDLLEKIGIKVESDF